MTKIGFLGPAGTFGQEALLTQPDLVAADLIGVRTMTEILRRVEIGELDFGFVALENAIEGTVNVSLDALIFDHQLFIQREVILPIHLNVIGTPSATLDGVKHIVSFPQAPPQCQKWLATHCPDAEIHAANSTAEAVREIKERCDDSWVAIANRQAAEEFEMTILASDVQDYENNATRFVLVAKDVIPARTGHDKTTIVCFQDADHPGSLHAILGEFSARAINLTKLESRPTKSGLGDYCFIVDLEGHINDEVVADCLRELHMLLPEVKVLGSYPVAGKGSEKVRRDADKRWRDADQWITDLRNKSR